MLTTAKEKAANFFKRAWHLADHLAVIILGVANISTAVALYVRHNHTDPEGGKAYTTCYTEKKECAGDLYKKAVAYDRDTKAMRLSNDLIEIAFLGGLFWSFYRASTRRQKFLEDTNRALADHNSAAVTIILDLTGKHEALKKEAGPLIDEKRRADEKAAAEAAASAAAEEKRLADAASAENLKIGSHVAVKQQLTIRKPGQGA